MKKFPVLLALFAFFTLVLTACSANSAPAATPSKASQPSVLTAEGRLLPVNTIDQSFSLPGQVAAVLVKDGDAVKTGQVLARLNDSPDARTALARAQQEALSARQTLDGLKTAADVNLAQANLAVVTAQKQIDAAKTKYDADQSDENRAKLDLAKAQLKQAEDALARLKNGAGVDPDQQTAAEARLTTATASLASAQAAVDALELKASRDGTVVDLTLQPGQRVSAGQPVMTLADFTTWVVTTSNLAEDRVIGVKIGQKVKVILDALPGSELSGEVSHINARYEEKQGDINYTVTIVISQGTPAMRWGMTASVQFIP